LHLQRIYLYHLQKAKQRKASKSKIQGVHLHIRKAPWLHDRPSTETSKHNHIIIGLKHESALSSLVY